MRAFHVALWKWSKTHSCRLNHTVNTTLLWCHLNSSTWCTLWFLWACSWLQMRGCCGDIPERPHVLPVYLFFCCIVVAWNSAISVTMYSVIFPVFCAQAIALPPIAKWPYQNGFTFSTWFRMDPLNNINLDKDKPYLYWWVTIIHLCSWLCLLCVVPAVLANVNHKKETFHDNELLCRKWWKLCGIIELKNHESMKCGSWCWLLQRLTAVVGGTVQVLN